MNRLRIILLSILIAVAYTAAGQGYVIDSVCRGAERHYRIDGEAGSSYLWKLIDANGVEVILPETADTVTINFNYPAGEYILSTLQTSIHGCDSLELGTIKVFDLPLAYAGSSTTRCNNNPFTFADATASGFSSLVWHSNGDGKFNDSTLLHPEYVFGTADLAVGSVTFTLQVTGFGRDGSCAPVESSVTITLKENITPVFEPIGPLCINSVAPILPAISTNGIRGTWLPESVNTTTAGISIYTFTPDAGQCGIITTMAIAVSSPEITDVQVYNSTNGLANGYAVVSADKIASAMAYSLNGIDWQTSNVFTKLQTGTYTVWVRNENGCSVSQSFVVLNSIAGEVKVTAGSAVNCITVPVEIPLKAYDFNEISAFTIQLGFDPSLMTFNGVTQMNDLLSNGVISSTIVAPGVLEIKFKAQDTLSLTNEDQLLSLNFNGIATGHSELKWNLLECVIYSAAGYEVPAIYTRGEVDIKPVPQIYTDGNGGYCESTPVKLRAGSLTGDVLNYNWTSPDGSLNTGSELNLGPLHLSDGGEYMVTASNGTTCSVTKTVDLLVYPNPHINLNNSDTLCSDQEVLLNAGLGFASYLWQDGSTQPQLMATSEGVYKVTVTDNNGCQASDSVLLKQCELLIWMPNVFSPNGDGVNDVFVPVYNPDVPISFQMFIFNKWGEQVFSSDDVSKGWDGTYKGKLCEQDVYTWTIKFSAPENYKFLQKSPQSGNVMLLK